MSDEHPTGYFSGDGVRWCYGFIGMQAHVATGFARSTYWRWLVNVRFGGALLKSDVALRRPPMSRLMSATGGGLGVSIHYLQPVQAPNGVTSNEAPVVQRDNSFDRGVDLQACDLTECADVPNSDRVVPGA
ncbi:hypothetical protein V1289_004657 [Bradyrhizobium sp. AZCC 2289]